MSASQLVIPKSVTVETVTDIKHWTDQLFYLRTTRPASFRFRSGEFIMLGLMTETKPLLRAYSIASPAWDEGLDFYSIKVTDGPLTSRLKDIKVGDEILLGRKPTGTLVLDALKPGKRLYLLSTGTGIAPFASVLREPETYEKFDEVILTHTCRTKAELGFGAELIAELGNDPLVGEIAPSKVRYYPTTTREESEYMGRITHLIDSGKLFADLSVPAFDPEIDRVMICGSMEMLQDSKVCCLQHNLEEGSNASPGDFVIEKAFAD